MGTSNYEAVVSYVTSRIRSGEWPPGQQLPTIRELADLTRTNQTAVKTAQLLLKERGWVRGQQGKATYVADNPPIGRADG